MDSILREMEARDQPYALRFKKDGELDLSTNPYFRKSATTPHSCTNYNQTPRSTEEKTNGVRARLKMWWSSRSSASLSPQSRILSPIAR